MDIVELRARADRYHKAFSELRKAARTVGIMWQDKLSTTDEDVIRAYFSFKRRVLDAEIDHVTAQLELYEAEQRTLGQQDDVDIVVTTEAYLERFEAEVNG